MNQRHRYPTIGSSDPPAGRATRIRENGIRSSWRKSALVQGLSKEERSISRTCRRSCGRISEKVQSPSCPCTALEIATFILERRRAVRGLAAPRSPADPPLPYQNNLEPLVPIP